MNPEQMAEPFSNTDFIHQYVIEHREELEELRAKANILDFTGDWLIIGDKNYPKKRLQYATSSFAEQYVSPRIILYPVGDQDIFKSISLCNDLGMSIAIRTGGTAKPF